jgi:hypothetical protein
VSRLPGTTLQRLRWAVRGVLALGVAASITANVLHARPNLISQVISAWPPLAFLITVELISRVPVHRRSLAGVRLVATSAIAGIAAWVSYWHMAAVASRYGETGASPYLLPMSVDGLIVIASVSLVELAGRIRAVAEQTTEPVPAPAPVVAEEPAIPDTSKPDTEAAPPRPAARRAGRPSAAKKVAKAAARMPDASVDKIAAKTKVSERTVRRHLAAMSTDPEPATAGSANGAAAAHLLRTTE